MKNLFFLLLFVFLGTIVSAQSLPVAPNHYSKLVKNANDAKNPISREYKKTGELPQGYSTATVSELIQKMGAVELWVEMDPAAWHNRQVNNGIFMAHYEEMIIDPNGKIHSAVKCSNFVPVYKFIYAQERVVVQEDCIECCENNVTINGQAINVNGSHTVKSNGLTIHVN